MNTPVTISSTGQIDFTLNLKDGDSKEDTHKEIDSIHGEVLECLQRQHYAFCMSPVYCVDAKLTELMNTFKASVVFTPRDLYGQVRNIEIKGALRMETPYYIRNGFLHLEVENIYIVGNCFVSSNKSDFTIWVGNKGI